MKILVADDDPVSRLALKTFLTKWGDDVVVAKDGAEASRLLLEPEGPKLAILDWMMPGADGVEICRQVRELAAEPYVYILILTARDSPDDIIAALEAGADDYLSKPFVPAELKARLLTGRRIFDLQQQLIKARDELRFEATHDSLTGVWNRAAILSAFRRELSRARRTGTSMAVTLADIDHFKSINDVYGHAAGDAALREVTRRMQASVRPYDSVGRYGGEEFLLICPGCDLDTAGKVAERVRQAISATGFEFTGQHIPITMSFGVAICGTTENEEALISRADGALYEAKNRGRNCVEFSPLPES
jgi:two-component system, cell cycle response regulator